MAEREKLKQSDYQPSLSLAQLGVDRNLDHLAEEVADRPHLIESTMVLAEPHALPPRVGLVLGWLAARALNRWQARPSEKGEGIDPLLNREVRNYQVMGEVDWPTFLVLALYLEKWRNSASAEALLLEWVELVAAANRGRDAEGLPSPYWLHEDVIALRTGQVPEYRQEYFGGQSYTVHPALDMLVRRMCRRDITPIWPKVSRIAFLDYRLDSPADWFLWKVRTGDLRIYHPPLPTSWSAWRKEVAEIPRG
ncbi:MAG TPA: hypothetical protein VLK84_02710, partial [Longimicrobium sp.]|nr:hypothetical protein [Longimicrobium sp.]